MSNLYIKAGKNYTLKLVYKDCDGFIVDITGASARIMMRRSMASDALVDVSANIDGPAGEIVFEFEPSDTANVLGDSVEDKLLYDVSLTLNDGKEFIILEGVALIRQSITRN